MIRRRQTLFAGFALAGFLWPGCSNLPVATPATQGGGNVPVNDPDPNGPDPDPTTGGDMQGSPAFPSKLQVRGKDIVDASGQPIVLRGVNPFPPIWQAMGEDPDVGTWSEANFDEMKAWGVQIVRLAIYPSHIRRYGYDASLAVIDEAIAWASDRGMYVILDFHSIGYIPDEDYKTQVDIIFGKSYETSREDVFEFWDIMSKRYRDNDVVAFYELFNEPALDQARDYPADYTIDDWMTWKTLMEELIDAIRGNDPDKVVMVGGFQFAYDLSFVPQAPVDRSNVVYTTHPYPDTDWQKDWATAFGDVALEYPVFATEFGFDAVGFPESAFGGEGVYNEALAALFNQRGIGWTAWSFSHAMTPRLLETEDFTPTPAGTFVKNQLSSKAN